MPIIAKDKFLGIVGLDFKSSKLDSIMIRRLKKLQFDFAQLYISKPDKDEIDLSAPFWQMDKKAFKSNEKLDSAPGDSHVHTFKDQLVAEDGSIQDYYLSEEKESFESK